MNKSKFLTLLIVGLLISNGILLFMFMNGPKKHKEPKFITTMLNGLKDWFDGDIANSICKEYTESIREEKKEEDKRGNEKIREETYRFIKGVF